MKTVVAVVAASIMVGAAHADGREDFCQQYGNLAIQIAESREAVPYPVASAIMHQFLHEHAHMGTPVGDALELLPALVYSIDAPPIVVGHVVFNLCMGGNDV